MINKVLVNSAGGQAANTKLMQLFADTCNIPVILPFSSNAAVVLGSAMLARFAAEVHELQGGKELKTQQDVDRVSDAHRERLWNIMVSCVSGDARLQVVMSIAFPNPIVSASGLIACFACFSCLVRTVVSGGDDPGRYKNRASSLHTREKTP